MAGGSKRISGGGAKREVLRLKRELAGARRRIAELEALAGSDPLTGVLNRRAFARAMDRALAFSRRYGTGAALAFFDIDRFKRINDEIGHAAGDRALHHVADALVHHVRRSDIVARIGGDEFVVLLWAAGFEDAVAKADQLRAAIEAPGDHPDVRISVGVTVFRGDDTVEDVLRRADAAMYEDKSRRRALRDD